MGEYNECRYCDGTGKWACYSCNGIGSKIERNYSYIPILGIAPFEIKICHICNGSGRVNCPYCQGTGRK